MLDQETSIWKNKNWIPISFTKVNMEIKNWTMKFRRKFIWVNLFDILELESQEDHNTQREQENINKSIKLWSTKKIWIINVVETNDRPTLVFLVYRSSYKSARTK